MRTGAGLAAVLAALVAPALEVGDVHAGMRARARPTGRVIAPASWSIMCRHMIDPRRPEHRLRWIVAAAAGALLPLAWVALSGHRIAWGDTTFMFAPLRPLVVEALRAGHLPLWNPYEGGGIPLFAQMVHGVLHPLSVIGALVAPGASMDVFVAAWVALAAAGAAVLACELGASPAASAVSGLAFGLSGYVLGMSVNILYLAGAASAPWVVAALRFAGRDGRLGTAAAAAAFACAAFAGDPQWAIVAALLGAALAADTGGLRGLARAGAGLALGVAIAAVQLVPSWQFRLETDRSGSPGIEGASTWALSPWRLLELVAPGFSAGPPGSHLLDPVYVRMGSTDPATLRAFVPSVFVGAIVLAVAAAGAWGSRRGRILAASAAVFLWMALGRLAGAEQVFRSVPVWGAFRYPEKLVGPFTLCAATLAAFGIDALATRLPPRLAKGTAILAGVAGSAALSFATSSSAADLLRSAGAGDAAGLAAARLASGLTHAAVALASLALLIAAARRWAAVRERFAPCAAGLVLLASLAATPFALHAGDRNARDEAPLLGLSRTDEVTRVATPLLANWLQSIPERWGPAGLDEADRALAIDSRMGAAPYCAGSRMDNVEPYAGLVPQRLALLFSGLSDRVQGGAYRAMRRFGVTHVVLRDPVNPDELTHGSRAIEGGNRIRSEPAWGLSVWEVPHRPWARFATSVVRAVSADDAASRVIDAAVSDRDEVTVEDFVPRSTSPGRVLRVVRGTERVVVEAEADGEGLLVVNDTWWPGWRATLDGRPVPIVRADFLVRAVPWPRGRHVLEMSYSPPELAAALWITALGTVTLVVLLIGPALRAWRKRMAS